ncbi:hypothetical protein C789_257 [Microcystis aeruginosa FACHB-905 = DIANCHI905]|nr:hypothetical protein C789_257 [Microcystis aeruginosa FACHB-905 = DIANCHI905]
MALMDVFTHFSIVRRERRGIRPEEIKNKRQGNHRANQGNPLFTVFSRDVSL